jgi:hypothetical protein
VWTRRKASCTQFVFRRHLFQTCICCLTCCTAMNRKYGVMRAIKDRRSDPCRRSQSSGYDFTPRYRGPNKNHEWMLAAFALVNLYLHRKRLVMLAA